MMSRRSRWAIVRWGACLLLLLVLPLDVVAASLDRNTAAVTSSMVFEQNIGQFPSQVRFRAVGTDGVLWLTSSAIWITQVGDAQQSVSLRLTFPEGQYLRLTPSDRAPGVLNRYVGESAMWRAGIPLWRQVRIDGVAPGVSLELDGRGAVPVWRLVRDYNAALSVPMVIEGAEIAAPSGAGIRLTTQLGDLVLPLAGAEVSMHSDRVLLKPTRSVAAADGDTGAATVMAGSLFGTYLGGDNFDGAEAVAVAADGSVYVTGTTLSTDFPRTIGSSTVSGGADIFVTRLSSDGTSLLYSTYLGGSHADDFAYDDEKGTAIAVDSNGFAHVTGWTVSDDFPTTAGAFDTSFNGPIAGVLVYADAFMSRLSATGALAYSTYLGGTGRYMNGARRFDDLGYGIAVHNGLVYVAGETSSDDFPTTSGAFDRSYGTPFADAFLAVLNPGGAGAADLRYSTYIGGADSESANGLAVDSAGIAYLTGYIDGYWSEGAGFPTTAGAYDRTIGDDWDAFVVKLNPRSAGASDLMYGTFLGRTGRDVGYDVAVAADGTIILIGSTNGADFPTTTGAFDQSHNGTYDAFVARLRPQGAGAADLRYSTYLGGSGEENNNYNKLAHASLDLTPEGDVLVTGYTESWNFPVTLDAQQSVRNGFSDAYVSRLQLAGAGAADLVYSTFLGGSGGEKGRGIVAIGEASAVVAGETDSYNFPLTPGAYDGTFGGEGDAFVARIAVPPQADLAPSTKSVAPNVAVVGEIVTFTINLVNAGLLDSATTVTDTLPPTLLFTGTPAASSGPAPVAAGQTLTWSGTVAAGAAVTITYTCELTSTTEMAPAAMNLALIDDGAGHIHDRRATVNFEKVFLPVVLRQ